MRERGTGGLQACISSTICNGRRTVGIQAYERDSASTPSLYRHDMPVASCPQKSAVGVQPCYQAKIEAAELVFHPGRYAVDLYR